MSLVYSTDHIIRALRKLLGQFGNTPKIRSLLATYVRQIQALEDYAADVTNHIGITNGLGSGLDAIGKIVRRGRMGLTDDQYRFALRAQIRINRAGGIPQDFIDVLMLSLDNDPAYSVELYTLDGGNGEVVLNGAVPLGVVNVLWFSVKQLPEAGVRIEFVWSMEPQARTFAFSAAATTSPSAHGPEDALAGFGSTDDASLGGFLAGVYGTS